MQTCLKYHVDVHDCSVAIGDFNKGGFVPDSYDNKTKGKQN